MRIAVFGMGYVGLVTAAGLAEWGHEVVGIEVDHERLEALRAGRMPFFEPNLDVLVEAGVAGERLRLEGHPGRQAARGSGYAGSPP